MTSHKFNNGKLHSERRSYFVFVNPKSGSLQGQRLLNQFRSKIFPLDINKQKRLLAQIFCISLFEKQSKKQFYEILKNKILYEQNKPVIIVAGGDGTICWVIQELLNENINLQEIVLAMLPIGTGNDFAKNLGWKDSGNLLANNYENLCQFLLQWHEAEQINLDIWNLTIQTYENGKIEKIINGKKHNLNSKIFNRIFCNYFSFGNDGKVVFEFDKWRSTHRNFNKFIYVAVGLKTIVKQNSIKINSFVSQFSQCQETRMQPTVEDPKQPIHRHNISVAGKRLNRIKTILSNNNHEQPNKKQQLSNFLCLNINRWLNGTPNIWCNASSQQMLQHDNNNQQPSCSDGRLQFIGFRNLTSMVLEKYFPGKAIKIAQGYGPYCIEFINSPRIKVYIEIDGEGFCITQPKAIFVEKASIPQGQIIVLQKRIAQA